MRLDEQNFATKKKVSRLAAYPRAAGARFEFLPMMECGRLTKIIALSIEDVPDRCRRNPESPAVLADPDTFVIGDKSILAHTSQKSVARRSFHRLRRQAPGHSQEFFPRRFPQSEGLLITVIQKGIRLVATREDHGFGIKKPDGLFLQCVIGRDQITFHPESVTLDDAFGLIEKTRPINSAGQPATRPDGSARITKIVPGASHTRMGGAERSSDLL